MWLTGHDGLVLVGVSWGSAGCDRVELLVRIGIMYGMVDAVDVGGVG